MTHTNHAMVSVEWTDSGFSFAGDSWKSESEIVERAQKWDGSSTTTGFLVYEDAKCLVICLTRDNEPHPTDTEPAWNWSQAMLIAKDSVRSIRTLVSAGLRPLAYAPATTSEEPSATPEKTTPPAVPRFGVGLDGLIGVFCPAHVRYEKRGTHEPLIPWEPAANL